jgi:hypothetical protein
MECGEESGFHGSGCGRHGYIWVGGRYVC